MITAASVVPSTNAAYAFVGLAGVNITAGQLLYLDSATNTVKLCHASTSLATASCIGVSLAAALIGQPVVAQTGGDYVVGAAITIGATLYTSVNAAGGVTTDVPAGGNFSCVWAMARTTTIATIINKGANPLTAHS